MGDAGGILVSLQTIQMCVAARADADHGKVETIVGAQDLPVALGGGLNSKTCCSHRQCIEKFTSINQFVSPLKPDKSC